MVLDHNGVSANNSITASARVSRSGSGSASVKGNGSVNGNISILNGSGILLVLNKTIISHTVPLTLFDPQDVLSSVSASETYKKKKVNN